MKDMVLSDGRTVCQPESVVVYHDVLVGFFPAGEARPYGSWEMWIDDTPAIRKDLAREEIEVLNA